MSDRNPVEKMIRESDPEALWRVVHVLSGVFYERLIEAPSGLMATMFARKSMREDGLSVDAMEFVEVKRVD